MSLTLGNIIILVIVGIIGIAMSIYMFCEQEAVAGIITIVVAIILVVALLFIFNWYNTSTATGIRGYKDFQSEFANGIEREITITAEDGRVIFHYEGRVDIETDHVDNYIVFESEDGKRYMIFYGITDTVLIVEK